MIKPPAPVPTQLTLNKKSRTLEVTFNTGEAFLLPCSTLRAASLSAEMRYLPCSKNYEHVNILAIEPIGNYAIKPIFSDGHNTGIYSWDTLYQLCCDAKKKEEETNGL